MEQNIIEKTLLENIHNQNAFFIFPTQTAADLWADKIVCESSVKSVAMERFSTWDKFKGSSIRGQQQKKRSVPAAMRSIFVSELIAQNAKEPFLKNLIVPEHAKSAESFANWLQTLLPPLFTWKKHFESANLVPDEEDTDLLALYERYNNFLEEHNYFDPAWETPPFKPDGNHYFVFFPEILSDYFEYESILEFSPESITTIHVPKKNPAEKQQKVHLLPNSRTEIRSVCLFLRNLYENKKISWDQIAVSVPDVQTYLPYIERDFKIYQIPFVSRNSAPLDSTGAGNFFNQVLNCKQQNFSFESIKNLLLNNNLPWKKEIPAFSLIEFGKENNCVCSFEYNSEKIDIWEKSFSHPKKNPDEQARRFYSILKQDINQLANSKTFTEIRTNYFIFREHFFDMSECTEKTNNILSRCITELGELIKLEEDKTNNIRLENPFAFYTNYLSGINYLAQTNKRGVQILPYKLSSCAPFKAQIVVDSSQNGLSVIYKQFSFLRDDKRKLLMEGKEDPNVSELFVKLYGMNSTEQPVFFTCAEKTFSGYAQSSSYLTEIKLSNNKTKEKDEELENLLQNDFYLDEKKYFLDFSSNFPKNIYSTQKKGEEFWEKCQKTTEQDISKSIEIEKNKIFEGNLFSESKEIQISSTTLRNFFACPRLWAIEKVGNLTEQINVVKVADHRTLGNLYHKIFELFCKELKKQNLPLQTEVLPQGESLPEDYKKILSENINLALQTEKNSYLTKELLKTTETAITKTVTNAILTFSKIFKGCNIFSSEESYEFKDKFKNCIYNGRIDCLLLDPSSTELFLVDFKSFDSAIPDNFIYTDDFAEGEYPDFQMPMYLYLLENQEKPQIVENCCFFNVTKAEVTQVFGSELAGRVAAAFGKKLQKNVLILQDFEPTQQKFKEAAETFIHRIETSDFSVSQEVQNFQVCNKCRCKAVCRRTFTVSRQN